MFFSKQELRLQNKAINERLDSLNDCLTALVEVVGMQSDVIIHLNGILNIFLVSFIEKGLVNDDDLSSLVSTKGKIVFNEKVRDFITDIIKARQAAKTKKPAKKTVKKK